MNTPAVFVTSEATVPWIPTIPRRTMASVEWEGAPPSKVVTLKQCAAACARFYSRCAYFEYILRDEGEGTVGGWCELYQADKLRTLDPHAPDNYHTAWVGYGESADVLGSRRDASMPTKRRRNKTLSVGAKRMQD